MVEEVKVKGAIYLIDDDPGGVMSIVRCIFPKMWSIENNDGIATYIGIFGNAAQSDGGSVSLLDSQDEKEFVREVEDELWERCNAYEESNGMIDENSDECKTFDKKLALLEGKVRLIYKSDDDSKIIEKYNNICFEWEKGKAGIKQPDENGNPNYNVRDEAVKVLDNLIERLEIPDNACVGLDLALLQGDMECTKGKEGPILSMQLYNILKKDHECFLYSKYVMDEEFVDGWKEVYNLYYEQDENMTIYQKNQLYQKELTPGMERDLIDMATKRWNQ